MYMQEAMQRGSLSEYCACRGKDLQALMSDLSPCPPPQCSQRPAPKVLPQTSGPILSPSVHSALSQIICNTHTSFDGASEASGVFISNETNFDGASEASGVLLAINTKV